jgi:hypothetical protein
MPGGVGLTELSWGGGAKRDGVGGPVQVGVVEDGDESFGLAFAAWGGFGSLEKMPNTLRPKSPIRSPRLLSSGLDGDDWARTDETVPKAANVRTVATRYFRSMVASCAIEKGTLVGIFLFRIGQNEFAGLEDFSDLLNRFKCDEYIDKLDKPK